MKRNDAVRKAAVAVTGGTLVATGVVLMPLPGPGTLIAFVGLGVLGSEFPAARRLLERSRQAAGRVRDRIGSGRGG
jgi:uncharacterized protein (TIGR02611 family)